MHQRFLEYVLYFRKSSTCGKILSVVHAWSSCSALHFGSTLTFETKLQQTLDWKRWSTTTAHPIWFLLINSYGDTWNNLCTKFALKLNMGNNKKYPRYFAKLHNSIVRRINSCIECKWEQFYGSKGEQFEYLI